MSKLFAFSDMMGGGVQCYLLFVAARGEPGNEAMYVPYLYQGNAGDESGMLLYTASRDNIRYIMLIVIRYKYVASLAQLLPNSPISSPSRYTAAPWP